MRAFPSRAELDFLIGKEIGQICLDSNSVQVLFWNGGRIHIGHVFEHIDAEGRSYPYDCAACSGPPLLLHHLIAKTITSLAVEPLRLTLDLNDGQKLILQSEEGPYECGQIWLADELNEGYIIY